MVGAIADLQQGEFALLQLFADQDWRDSPDPEAILDQSPHGRKGVHAVHPRRHYAIEMQQAENVLMATGAVAPIYYYTNPCMTKPNVEGLIIMNTGDVIWNYVTLK